MKQSPDEKDYYKNMVALTNEMMDWLLKGLDSVDAPNQKQQPPNQFVQNTNAAQNNQQTPQNADGPQLGQLSSSQTNATPRDLDKACGAHDDLITANTSENENTNAHDNANENDSINSLSFQ